jgi:SAM-dependent methyltransferase
MDRQAWLRGRGAWAEHAYTANAPTYDEHDPPITPTHEAFLARVIASVPVGGAILDAPCGTGRFFVAILAAGRRVTGIDQSTGMLAQARARHPKVALQRIRLQELGFEAAFDAAICVDAMEYVPPEDWPVVLANFRRAVRPGGLVYLTVEQIDSLEVAHAYVEAVAAGLPVVPGEHHRRGGGYHHYPTREQVAAWLAAERLEVVAEGQSPGSNYSYLHLLVRAR